jgi:hypothetical protein
MSLGCSRPIKATFGQEPQKTPMKATLITACGEQRDIEIKDITWSVSREVIGDYGDEQTQWSDTPYGADSYSVGKEVIVGSIQSPGPEDIFGSCGPFTLVVVGSHGRAVFTGLTVTQHTSGLSENDDEYGNTTGYSFVALAVGAVNR